MDIRYMKHPFIHLLTSLSRENAQHLPKPHQKMLLFLWIATRRVDDQHVQRGDRPNRYGRFLAHNELFGSSPTTVQVDVIPVMHTVQ